MSTAAEWHLRTVKLQAAVIQRQEKEIAALKGAAADDQLLTELHRMASTGRLNPAMTLVAVIDLLDGEIYRRGNAKAAGTGG